MRILEGLDGLCALPPRTIMTIGNYDGMHIGHRRLIDTCRSLRTGQSGGLAVVTFEPHPLTVLRPPLAPPRLSPPDIKQRLLREAGVDYLVELPPAPEVLNLSAEAFWTLLKDRVRPTDLVEGDNFNFGKDRGGNVESLREWSAGTDIRLHVVEPVKVVLLDLQVVSVSSSLIRWLLANGRVRDAAICLGHAYLLQGKVIQGHRRGHKLGFPTANLDCGDQHIPADGVYAGRCTIDGRTWPAAISIGTLPTFGKLPRQLEVHLIDFDGDLYGRTLGVEIVDWLRDQRRFIGPDALVAQMRRDVEIARSLAGRDPARPIAAAG